MKLPNSLTGTSNRGSSSGRERSRWHRWIPAWIVAAYLGCFFVWPVIQDLRALFFVPFGLLLGNSYWFTALGLPNSVQLILAALLAIILFSLPWFSVLSGTRRATMACTFGVIVVLLMQISDCHLQRQKGNATLNQAQRACVMQPRVRRTLGIESPHVFISSNPNGVPSKVDRSQAFTMSLNSRRMDATPLRLVVGIAGGSSRYPGLFQPWSIVRKPLGLVLSSPPIADMNDLAGLHIRQLTQDVGNKRQQIVHVVAGGMQDHEANGKGRNMLLVDHVPVDGDERLKFCLCADEQMAVLDPVPAHFLDRQHRVRTQMALQPARQVLIKQQAHDQRQSPELCLHPSPAAPMPARGSRTGNHPGIPPTGPLCSSKPPACLLAHEFL